MTSAWSQLEQMLTCAICLDKFKNPRLLPCQHSFCGDACMEGLVDYARRQIKCPECRAEHRIPYQGVSSLPSNVTLIRFLELHSRITGEEPEPVPTFMEKCSVCGEKVDGVQRCAHCEKKVCPECKEAHIDILRREVNRLNGQTKRCFGKMQEFKETLEKSEERLRTNHKTVKRDIEESCRRLMDDLQAKQRRLIEEVGSFAEQEQKTIDKLKVALVSELDVLESNSKLADEKLCSNKFAWTDTELCEMKEIYARAMEFVRLFDPDIGDCSRKIRFSLIPEFDSLRRRLCELGELKFGESATALIASSFQYCNASGQVALELCSAAAAATAANAGAASAGGYGLAHSSSNTNLGGGSASSSGGMLELPSMQNALMRSQSDHRLASQFQQRLKQQQQDANSAAAKNNGASSRYIAGQRGVPDYDTDSLRSRYAPPRASVAYGGAKDYNNDWPRPSDTDSNAGDSHFGPSIQFKSAFMRRKEKERQQLGYSSTLGRDYDDDDLTSEASYGGASSSGRNVHFYEPTGADGTQIPRGQQASQKFFDCKEVERAPFSGVPKLEESAHLDMRLHQMGAKAVVDKKLAEEEGKRDKDLVDSARHAVSQQQAMMAQRQMSEDEIEKQKRANQRLQESSPAPPVASTPMNPATAGVESSSQMQQSSTATMTRASNFRSRRLESEESHATRSDSPAVESNSNSSTAVDADQQSATSRPSVARTTRQQAETSSAQETGESSSTAPTVSTAPWISSARRNLYGQAVTEKSKRQLSNAAQEAAAAASYSRRRATAAAAAASSSAEGEQSPAEASSSAAPLAGGSTAVSGRGKKSLRSSGRSLSKQSSTEADATNTIQRRRRQPTRGDSLRQTSVEASDSKADGVGSQSKNYAGSGDGLSENLVDSSQQESLMAGRQAAATGSSRSSPYSGGSYSRVADRTSTTTDEDDDADQDEREEGASRGTAGASSFDRSYSATSRKSDNDRKSSTLATNNSDNNTTADDDDDGDDVEDNDDNDDDGLGLKSGYGSRGVGNRRSRELMPNAVNKLLDRSAQIRRDSQEQRSRGDSPQRGLTGRSYASTGESTSSTTTPAPTPKQSSFYASARSSGGSGLGGDAYSTSSSPGSLSTATRQRLAYHQSQSIRDSHDDFTNTTNSNNSLYTTASSGSHAASSAGRKSSLEDEPQGVNSASLLSGPRASRRLSGNSSDRTLVSHDSSSSRPSCRRDSSDHSSPAAYHGRLLSRSRTSAALSGGDGNGSSNRSQDTTSSDTTPSHHVSRMDSYHHSPSGADSEPTVSTARSYLSSRDRFMQSAALMSSSGSGAGSAGSPSGAASYSRSSSSAVQAPRGVPSGSGLGLYRHHPSSQAYYSDNTPFIEFDDEDDEFTAYFPLAATAPFSLHSGPATKHPLIQKYLYWPVRASPTNSVGSATENQPLSNHHNRYYPDKSTHHLSENSRSVDSFDEKSTPRVGSYQSKASYGTRSSAGESKLSGSTKENSNYTSNSSAPAEKHFSHTYSRLLTGGIKTHSEYLRNKFATARKNSSTSSAGSSTTTSLMRSRSSHTGFTKRRASATGSKDDEQSHQGEDNSDTSEKSSFETKTTNSRRSSLASGDCNAQFGVGRSSVYCRKKRLLFKLGSRGNEPGNFTWPRGVAAGMGTHGGRELVVADSSNHRVQVFDSKGRFIREFGSYGSAPGQFDCLAGVAINRPTQNYVVSDRYNHRVQVFDFSGRFVRAFGELGREPGKFNLPWGVACDASGLIYVCDKENHRIQVFDVDGTHLAKFGVSGSQVGQLQHPHYIAVNQGKLVVTDTNNHRAQIFDLSGRLINSFGREGSASGQFKFPRGVAMDDLGHIIVGDSGNNRLQIFNSEGTFVKSIGTWGSADGEFKGIEGVAVDSDYNILVCDRENHRIQVF